MRRKKNHLLLPITLFVAVLILSVGGLILAQNLRRARTVNPGEIANQDDILRLTAEEAYQAAANGEAVLVDTRSETEFQAQHAAGAINIPVNQAEALVSGLDPNTWYITYCT
ncbi:MAG: rhodanese-like domain-containing protein [Brevefilum sp.]